MTSGPTWSQTTLNLIPKEAQTYTGSHAPTGLSQTPWGSMPHAYQTRCGCAKQGSTHDDGLRSDKVPNATTFVEIQIACSSDQRCIGSQCVANPTGH